jgi:hypothetical protein
MIGRCSVEQNNYSRSLFVRGEQKTQKTKEVFDDDDDDDDDDSHHAVPFWLDDIR